jgi:hypothetical protein
MHVMQRTLVLGRDDLDEARPRGGPVVQQLARAAAAGAAQVLVHQGLELLLVGLAAVPVARLAGGLLLGRGQHLLQRDGGAVAALANWPSSSYT